MWIWGNGGHAKVVRHLLERGLVTGAYDGVPLHFIDDAVEPLHWKDSYGSETGVIAVGNNEARKRIALGINHANYYILWSTKSDIAELMDVGLGTVVMAHGAINAGAWVGRHCIVNTSASVDHDSRIGDYVHIAPGAHLCGNVSVGEGTLIGAGTIVTPGVTIGPWLVIPAGSVVTKDCMNENDVAALRKR